jgi:hypothetical protein
MREVAKAVGEGRWRGWSVAWQFGDAAATVSAPPCSTLGPTVKPKGLAAEARAHR